MQVQLPSGDRSPFDVLLLDHHVPSVLLSVFLSLDVDSLSDCRLVCRRWKCFIDEHIMADACLRRKVAARRLAELWHDCDGRGGRGVFVQHELKVDPSIVSWREFDVEGVDCREQDIIMASSDCRMLLLRNMVFKKVRTLPGKIKTFYVGGSVIVAVLNLGNAYVAMRRENLEILGRFEGPGPSRALDFPTPSFVMGRKEAVHSVDKNIYVVFDRTTSDNKTVFCIDKIRDSDGKLEAFRQFEGVNSSIDSCGAVAMNSQNLLLASQNGKLMLLDYTEERPTKDPLVLLEYSPSPDNIVKEAVLTTRYCGLIYQRRSACVSSYVLFDLSSSNEPLAERRNISYYGRIFFSASPRFCVFAYGDALHNQHFIIHDFSKGKSGDPVNFVLLDRYA